MIAIIGLGNPEEKYKATRHNIGWQILDALHTTWKFVDWDTKPKFKSFIAKGTVQGQSVMLVKPTTYMNNSGDAVKIISSYFDILPEHIWVIHDELDLPLGTFKITTKKGAASHNGVISIFEQLGTNNFYRWRIGISNNPKKRPKNSHNFVLKKFGLFEKSKKVKMINEVVQSIERSLKTSARDGVHLTTGDK